MSRRRSIIVMTLLWTVASAIIGACYGAGLWLLKRPPFALTEWMGMYATVASIIGVVGGGIFSLALTRRDGIGSIDELRLRAFARLGAIAGALAGISGFVLISLMMGKGIYWEPAALYCTVIGAVAGGATTAGMLAFARRAPAISAGKQDLIEP